MKNLKAIFLLLLLVLMILALYAGILSVFLTLKGI